MSVSVVGVDRSTQHRHPNRHPPTLTCVASLSLTSTSMCEFVFIFFLFLVSPSQCCRLLTGSKRKSHTHRSATTHNTEERRERQIVCMITFELLLPYRIMLLPSQSLWVLHPPHHESRAKHTSIELDSTSRVGTDTRAGWRGASQTPQRWVRLLTCSSSLPIRSHLCNHVVVGFLFSFSFDR